MMQGFTVPDSDRIEVPQEPARNGPRIRQIIPPAPKAPSSKTSYATLSPGEVKSLGLPPGSYQRSSEGKIDKVADAPKAGESQATFREPIDKIINVIDAAANVHRLSRSGGVASSPMGRYVASKIPGTAANDMLGFIDTVGSNTAFETLAQMRQESPTGGAVGNVSDKDLALLRSTIAPLRIDQSNEKLQRDAATVLRSYQKVLYKLPGGKEAYHNWRVNWLGYDPDNRGQVQPQAKPRVIDFNDLP